MNRSLKEAFVFIGLTLALSFFVFWGPLALFQIPTISFVGNTRGPIWAILLFIFGGFVPSLAGLFLTWKNEGRKGLQALWHRMTRFNIGWRWYLAAVMVVAIGTMGQLAIQRLLGYAFDEALFLNQIGSLLPLLILGPLSEEIGWRGYALYRLQTKWNALFSSLMIGLVWGFWHLPLFAMVGTSQHELGIPFIGFVCGLMANSVVYTWLQNNTQGSIWTAIFFHWIYTYSAQVVATGVTRSNLFNWLEYLPYLAIAIVIVLVWKPQTLQRKAEGITQQK